MSHPNLDAEAHAKATINRIFTQILENVRKTLPNNNQNLYIHQIFEIEEYRDALLDEVNQRGDQSDHPLRAAFALDKLHHSRAEEFDKNLKNFQNEALNSHFYPTTRKVALIALTTIVSAALIALTWKVSIFFILLSMPATLLSLATALPISQWYNDIYNAKMKSKPVFNFYSMFRKPPPTSNEPSYEQHKEHPCYSCSTESITGGGESMPLFISGSASPPRHSH